jgi:hypothetical protein
LESGGVDLLGQVGFSTGIESAGVRYSKYGSRQKTSGASLDLWRRGRLLGARIGNNTRAPAQCDPGFRMFGRSGAKDGTGELGGRGAGENTLFSTVRIATLDPVRKGRLCPGPGAGP